MIDKKEFPIRADDDGIRLDRWFKRHLEQVPHALLNKHLRKGDVRIDGKKAEINTRVEKGQVITLPIFLLKSVPGSKTKEKVQKAYSPEEQKDMRRMVLFENKDCFVLNKPAELAVQGGSKVKDSLDDKLYLLSKGSDKPRLVHRLDRDTSGCIVVAKSATAAGALTKAFAGREVEKVYWALIVGVPSPREGLVKLPLAKRLIGGEEKMVVDEEEGKKSVTEFRVLDSLSNKLSLVELIPVTGRTHQLRVHMAAVGHPILGDGKYGGRGAFIDGLDLPRQLHLHARRIAMEKPFALDVTAPLPKHMKQSIKSLGLETDHD